MQGIPIAAIADIQKDPKFISGKMTAGKTRTGVLIFFHTIALCFCLIVLPNANGFIFVVLIEFQLCVFIHCFL